MSVEIIIGRAGSGKTFSCLKSIESILKNSPLDTKIIFLLPAYQTYRAELELVKITGGSVNTRMCSFQRFSKQILEEVGGAIVPRISEIGKRILLRKILINQNDLKFYKKSAKQRGFAEKLSDEISEFRTYNISPKNLRETLNKISNDELSDKISDLANLTEIYRNAIADKQNDESDLLEKAASFIKFSSEIKNTEIFIDGFIFFDPQQRKILREIFKYAKNVHVALPMDCEISSYENQNSLGIFNRAFETFKTLKDYATDTGADFFVTKCENQHRFLSAELEFIEKNIFTHNQNKFVGENKNFKIVSAVNKRVEVEAVARDVLKIRREKNFKFREIGIIARDESYNDLLKNIFEIHEIPFFIDDKRPAVNHQFAEFIRSTLEIFHGWRADSIFRCLRTGFFNISAEKIDLLENYVIEFGIRGEKNWSENWTKHKHKLEKKPYEDFSESEKLRLAEINSVRREVSAPILKFSKNLKKKKSAREFAVAFYNFIDELKISEKLSQMSEAEEMRGNLALSREHLKIWDDVMNLFEQISDTIGDDVISLQEFEFLINEGLDALEMSMIPPGPDEVTISKFDQNSLQNSRAIYILGFNDVSFPKRADEKFLLSDADRLHLIEDCNLEISRGGKENLLAEKFLIYRGITEARNYLQISYSLADSEGREMCPANLIEKLKNFFDIEVKTENLEILSNFGSGKDFLIEDKKISADTAKKLFAPAKKIRGSVTNFQTYNECAFKYFAKFGLNLQERTEYKIQAPDIGNILHAVMKDFGEKLHKENKMWRDVGSDELEIRVEKIIDDLTGNLNNKILLSKSSYRHRRERIKKVAISSLKRLIELDKVSKFHPELFEERFNNLNNKMLSLKISGVEVEVVGVIDRIDFNESGKYFLIIDYKTGEAYLNLNEIYFGVNIQLLTYLTAAKNLEKVGEKLPAAMLYYFLKYPKKTGNVLKESEKEISDELKMDGWILADKNIVYEVDESLNFIKVGFNKGDVFSAAALKNYVKDEKTFNAMMSWAKKVFHDTCEKILSGEIFVKPYRTSKKDSCEYCIYAELCGFNEKTDEIKNSDIDDDEIMKEIFTNSEK